MTDKNAGPPVPESSVVRPPEPRPVGPASHRLCVMCQWIVVDPGHEPWSDVTPGDDAMIKCGKGHWWMENRDGTEMFRQYIRKAETCTDFQEAE